MASGEVKKLPVLRISYDQLVKRSRELETGRPGSGWAPQPTGGERNESRCSSKDHSSSERGEETNEAYGRNAATSGGVRKSSRSTLGAGLFQLKPTDLSDGRDKNQPRQQRRQQNTRTRAPEGVGRDSRRVEKDISPNSRNNGRGGLNRNRQEPERSLRQRERKQQEKGLLEQFRKCEKEVGRASQQWTGDAAGYSHVEMLG